MHSVTLLGGGTPYTVAMVEALVDDLTARPYAAALTLQGRKPDLLEALASFAGRRLAPFGWTVRSEMEVERALDGATLVVQQIRFGGLEGRAEIERFALRHGIVADETLGPAGLLAALHQAPEWVALSRTIARVAPEAVVLNMTNPLSLSCSVLSQERSVIVYGLCELPMTTAHEAITGGGHAPDAVNYCYTGLNHRGFLHNFRENGRDLWPEILEGAAARGIGGVAAGIIEELGAVPLSYFSLCVGPAVSAPSRAEALARLREAASAALMADSTRPPAQLKARRMDWYSDAVAPALAGLAGGYPVTMTLNMVDVDGITRERRAEIVDGVVLSLYDPAPPSGAARWLERFEAVEVAQLSAVFDPSRANLDRAITCDPLCHAAASEPIVDEIIRVTSDLGWVAA